MNVAEILNAAQSVDHGVRSKAEALLLEAQESNFQGYLSTLADYLAGEGNEANSRKLAGLIMKNALFSKSYADQALVSKRWRSTVDAATKVRIRQLLLDSLRSPIQDARRASAQVIAKIASIDFSEKDWEGLPQILLKATLEETSKDFLRESSLETLGYIYEEGLRSLPDVPLIEISNQALSAVVYGMNYAGSAPCGTPDTATAVRLAATRALFHLLEFSQSQFNDPGGRAAIMEAIYNSARSENQFIRCAAFEVLVQVAEVYYDKLPEYIHSLYELTNEAICKDVEPVALQAIEFWTCLAEEEISLLEEAQTAREMNENPERVNHNFVPTALPFLMRSIFESLKKQEDELVDDITWNSATAAGSCLELLAQAAPTQILALVMPFVRENINDGNNWRGREAAILAFGSVLEGPPITEVQGLVREAVPIFIRSLKSDPNIYVRDTTAWTLARSIMVDKETTVNNLNDLVECLRSSLTSTDSPVLAAHVCFAVHNLALCFADEADEASAGSLGEHVEVLLRAVLAATDREDGGEARLRFNAYEALCSIFRSVAQESLSFVLSCVPLLLEKLEKSFPAINQAVSRDDVAEIMEVQGLLCGALQVATERLGIQHLSPFADRMMAAYLQLFSRPSTEKTVHEDSLYAIGAIVDKSGREFMRYMPHFLPILSTALATNNLHQDEKHTLVGIAVSVVTEIARGIGPDLGKFSDQIVSLLLEALKSPVLNRAIKPPILSALGDIAMALRGNFERYLKMVMDCMKEAAHSSVSITLDPDDFDTLEFVMALREAIFEAYIGIISGLKDENKEKNLEPYVEWLIAFAEIVDREILANPTGTDALARALVCVLGDAVDAMPDLKANLRQRSWVSGLLERGNISKDKKFKESSSWARIAIYQD